MKRRACSLPRVYVDQGPTPERRAEWEMRAAAANFTLEGTRLKCRRCDYDIPFYQRHHMARHMNSCIRARFRVESQAANAIAIGSSTQPIGATQSEHVDDVQHFPGCDSSNEFVDTPAQHVSRQVQYVSLLCGALSLN